MARIKRVGRILFNDASLNIIEEPDHVNSEFELKFKKEVFLRIVQQLNRIGWICEIPEDAIMDYGSRFAESMRYCSKGELHADLSVSGRCIELKMFQNVNAPDRPDHGGRHEFNKELLMPYLLKLEMERSRKTIRDYLCNVFDGYEFKISSRNLEIGVSSGNITALESAAIHRRESGHYVADLDRARISNTNQGMSADGVALENGMRVYALTYSGRFVTGTAFYSLNSNWQVVTGKHELLYICHNQLWVNSPGNLRIKRNSIQRRKRLEAELSKSIKSMDFERSCVLRDIIYPKNAPLFVVFNNKHSLYHRPEFCGYTDNIIDAGKFTADEVKGWHKYPNKVTESGDNHDR